MLWKPRMWKIYMKYWFLSADAWTVSQNNNLSDPTCVAAHNNYTVYCNSTCSVIRVILYLKQLKTITYHYDYDSIFGQFVI